MGSDSYVNVTIATQQKTHNWTKRCLLTDPTYPPVLLSWN